MAVFGSWPRRSGAMSAQSGMEQGKGCPGIRSFYRADCKNPVPKQNYKPGFNGCGPEGGVFGTGINAVPNNPLFLANFRPACNTHDVGYSTCNRTKEDTDWQFLVDTNSICNNQYPGSGMFDTVLLANCKYSATTFYVAVKDGGEDAFKAGQADSCDCCDECPGGGEKCNKQICCKPGDICIKPYTSSRGLYFETQCCPPCPAGFSPCPDDGGSPCPRCCLDPRAPVCCWSKQNPPTIQCCRS